MSAPTRAAIACASAAIPVTVTFAAFRDQDVNRRASNASLRVVTATRATAAPSSAANLKRFSGNSSNVVSDGSRKE